MEITLTADSSLQNAINRLPQDGTPVTIHLKNGVYREKVALNRPNVSLIGEDPGKTVISWDDHALRIGSDGEKMGTFNSFTILIGAPDFYAENITFENTAGPGKKAGQALAAYVDGDRAHFRNCRFLGWQDTLFTGPLPQKEGIPNGFKGPRQDMPRVNTRQYYENCYIQGDVDFIFGSATAYFDGCTIVSNDLHQEVNGYLTAPSTPENIPYGYVFSHCRMISGCAPGTVYLLRPWRNHAKAAFLHCDFGAHIHPEGYHDWNKPESRDTMVCAEYGNHGPGASLEHRAPWLRVLTQEEAKSYQREAVLNGTDLWAPWNRHRAY